MNQYPKNIDNNYNNINNNYNYKNYNNINNNKNPNPYLMNKKLSSNKNLIDIDKKDEIKNIFIDNKHQINEDKKDNSINDENYLIKKDDIIKNPIKKIIKKKLNELSMDFTSSDNRNKFTLNNEQSNNIYETDNSNSLSFRNENYTSNTSKKISNFRINRNQINFNKEIINENDQFMTVSENNKDISVYFKRIYEK